MTQSHDKDYGLRQYGLTFADQHFLQQEIAKAEGTTQSEIVLGLTKRSSAYDFIALAAGILIAFTVMTVVAYLGLWRFSFVSLQLAQVCLAVLLQVMLVQTGWVMAFVPRAHQLRAANRASRDLFYDHDLQMTDGRNALLIFVSLQERMIFLLPDKTLHQRVPGTIWDEVVKGSLEHRAKNNLTQWLGYTIRACAQILRRYDPATAENDNELPNTIRFL